MGVLALRHRARDNAVGNVRARLAHKNRLIEQTWRWVRLRSDEPNEQREPPNTLEPPLCCCSPARAGAALQVLFGTGRTNMGTV